MAFLWSKKRPAPDRVPTDDVIPLHSFDDMDVYRAIVLDFSLRFDDVLDHEKLRLALVRLLEIGDWRKLGARLRRNSNGKLEYHIPESFDEKRPGFTYKHIECPTKIQDHPVASKIPRASSQPLVLGDVEEFRPLTHTPGTPKTLDDFLYADCPQLSVAIISFEDATLFTINWPHTFSDAMGMAALFKNWIAVMEGREGDVQPLQGYDSDPLAGVGDEKSTPPSIVGGRLLTGLPMLIFAVRYIFDLIWNPKEEARVVCLPAHFVQSLKQKALDDLAEEDGKSESKPFLSDGDVICAWWARRVVEALELGSNNKTILIMNACDMRRTLSKGPFPPNLACVSNISACIFTFVSAVDLCTQPLSSIASKIRQSIVEQRTVEQTAAFVSLARSAISKTGRGPIFGDATMTMVVYSNWTAAKFFDLDWSSAVVKEGLPSETRSNPPGRPSFVNCDGNITGISSRGTFPILGRDAGGNYWIRGNLRSGIWPKIEKFLLAM